MNDMSTPLRMPGAISISRLRVYDTLAPDGQRGGTPHVHLACAEMYFVLEGAGAVEMIDANGFSCVELHLYTALTFSPGTVHRLINPNGDLNLLVMMQNSGLPEKGDNVVSFTEEWLISDEHYAEAMRVASLADAYRRRDRGVEGFLRLKAAFAENVESGQAALLRFLQLAAQRTAQFRPEWGRVIEQGAASEVRQSLDQLQALDNADFTYLLQAQQRLIPAGAQAAIGFCGQLDRYPYPEALAPEGLRDS